MEQTQKKQIREILDHPTLRFLDALYQNCEGGLINIRIVPPPPGGKVSNFFSLNEERDLEKIRMLVNTQKKNTAIYSCVALRSGEDGTKNGIYLIPGPWLEHDHLDQTVEQRIKDFVLQPSIIVQSSLPIKKYFYWLLKEPASKAEIERIENLNHRLATFFGGDHNSCEAAHPLRIPGTINYKPEYASPMPCTLLETHPDRQYSLEDFEAVLPEARQETSRGIPAPSFQEEKQRILEGVKQGSRDWDTFRYASSCIARGMTQEETLTLCQDVNKKHNPPMDSRQVEEKVNSAYKTHFKNHPPEVAPDNGDSDFDPLLKFHTTETGNAECFKLLFENRLVYIKEKGTWFKFDGVRWIDTKEEAIQAMIDTVRKRMTLAIERFHPESKEIEAWFRWCMGSEAFRKINDSLKLASMIMIKSQNDFDKDPWLLACKNGVLDLKTGMLRPGCPEDMLQRSTNIVYDPQAECPRWKQFLSEIFDGDEELIGWTKRVIGYSLTGSIKEQILFMLYGTGQNGKTVLLTIMEKLLGEYSEVIPFSVLKLQKYDTMSNEIAKIAGARMVKSVEVKENARLNEERIKALTGGDRISARFLYHEPFSFTPINKLWLGVNHLPPVAETTFAYWRRIRTIPFNVTFTEETRDRDLTDKLKLELVGILSWAVEGCLEYQRDGLEPPPHAVRTTTENYQIESDIINQFLEQKTVKNPDSKVYGGELYQAYDVWCKANNEHAITGSAFGKRIKEKGYEWKRSQKIEYLGLELIP